MTERETDLVIGNSPIDLGDMKLGRPSIALEGIILGDDKPYRGFSKPYLYVERYTGTPETKNPESYWRRVKTVVCAMGRAGAFTVQGKLGRERHRLGINATKAGYLEHPPIEFRVGQKGLKILLESAASFRAQLELDPPDMAQGLVLKMEQTDAPPGTQQDGYRFYGKGPGGPRSQGRRRPPPRKTAKSRVTWLWESLAPGTYRLTLHCAGYAQPLATFDGIRLKARRLNTDRRLRPYDLRGKVQSLVLTILDAEGKPPQSIAGRPPLVFVGKPREGRPVTAYAIPSSGRVTIAAPQLPVRALVAVRGARLEWVEGISSNRTIRLKAEPTLRLKLRGGSRKLPPGMVLAVDFAAPKILGMDRQADLRVGSFFASTGLFLPRGGGAVLASDGTGTISLPCAGDYTVSFRIREDRNDWWKGKRAFIRAEPPNQVQIKDLQETQELHLSQKSIDAALATLRR